MNPREPGPQKIPRPPAARPGAAPPWPTHDPEGPRPRIALDHLRAAVADTEDVAALVPEAAGSAAVLCAAFEEEGEARIILTRRTEWLRSHSHQVAFPGGRLEPDETPVQAALREAWEEVGLDPDTVTIVGRLGRMATISSPMSSIHPFVGVLPGRPELHPNPDEVERVFDVAVAELMEDGCFREEIWGVGEGERPIYFFELGGETIWGATARMIYELLDLLDRGLNGPSVRSAL
ncbi:MAG TPA: CoA pyrophosphatase [Acidimicrobiales bacterium]|nr:CoA pyrophosphatase [Acidimicrobiales bacterium]